MKGVKVKVNDEDYEVRWHGPLGVALIERDLPLDADERGGWTAAHVKARYALAVKDKDGNEWVVNDSLTYKYNPNYAPNQDEELTQDILECCGLDFGYDNEYWPDSDDPDEVAQCALRYVREMLGEVPGSDEEIAALVRSIREPGRLWRLAVALSGDEGALVAAAGELRELANS